MDEAVSTSHPPTVGQGRENAKEFLRNHPDVAGQIEQKVREQLGIPAAASAAVPRPSERREKRSTAVA